MNTARPQTSDESLLRALGPGQLAATIVNATIGAGIFLLPGLVFQSLGAAAPLAFVVCGGAMLLIVTSFAVAGSRVSLTGGLFAYVEIAFGPFFGFLAGVLQWLVFLLSVGGVASALLEHVHALLPALGSLGRAALLAIVLAIVAGVNVRGVTMGARVITGFATIKVLTLLFFIAIGSAALDWHALAPPVLPEGGALGRTVLLLIFAFIGVEVALAPSGEIRQPARTVPRGIYLALAITTVLYIGVQIVAQGVLGSALAQHTDAPLAEATGRLIGPAGRTLILLATMCSMFGYVTGDMLSSPRTLFAFARDGFIPRVFARVHPRFRTPHVAIWTHALLVVGIATSSTFQRLAIIANVGTLTLYLLGCVAAMQLVRRDVRQGGVPFAIPGGRYVPPFAAAVILWILSNATGAELGVTAGVLAVAAVVYGAGLHSRARRTDIHKSAAPGASATDEV